MGRLTAAYQLNSNAKLLDKVSPDQLVYWISQYLDQTVGQQDAVIQLAEFLKNSHKQEHNIKYPGGQEDDKDHHHCHGH